MRVLAVAEKKVDRRMRRIAPEGLDELTLLGFRGLKDPVRPTSADSVAQLHEAGVRVIMITGDHPATAQGIAEELGLPTDHSMITGVDVARMTDAELSAALEEANVCARVSPADKVRIVRALRRTGSVVAMTGDGANDAPAIRLADVGIALGTRATSAARDASDLVVTDDRIETIVAGIVEGRALWASVRDATAILVGGNLGEIAFTLGGSLVTGKPPLNARQLLFVNLMTDVAPAMAIAMSPPRHITPTELLREGPDRSLGEALNRSIAVRALTTTSATTAAWLVARLTGRRRRADTVALAALVLTELGQTVAVGGRSRTVDGSSLASTALTAGVIQTPGLSRVFGCTPLGPIGWSQAITAATIASIGAGRLDAMIERSGFEFSGMLERLERLTAPD